VGAVVHRRVEPRAIESVPVLALGAAFVLALVPIYAIGVPWFAGVQGWSLARAAEFMALFAVGDLIKAAVATVGVVGSRELLARAG